MRPSPLYLPDEIEDAMQRGAAMSVSISGGKDSQALAIELAKLHRQRQWTGPIFALHMDLGRAEWAHTPHHVEKIARENDLDLIVVRRPQGDLVQEIQDRMATLRGTDKPFWPSSAQRYCTSDQKRGQADKVYRNLGDHLPPFWPSNTSRYCASHQKTNQADKVYRQHDLVISVEGIRADESPARRKKTPIHVRKQITAKRYQELTVTEALHQHTPGQRVAINWFPLFDWDVNAVWNTRETTQAELDHRRDLYRHGDVENALDGWPFHPAYVFGNERLSCAICMLASNNDIRNGARHNPELYEIYRQMELDGGSTLKQGKSLEQIVSQAIA